MKYLLISLLFITSCKAETICDYETQQCHSKEEWDKISDRNWKMVRCLQKQFDKKVPEEKAYKRCGVVSVTTVELR